MFSFAMIPMVFPTLIMFFAAMNPTWECVPGNVICTSNATFPADNHTRCSMPRGAWRYTEPDTFSIVTQFDLSCSRQWMIYLTTSIFFFGWLVGSMVTGWAADMYGRKTILYPCLAMVIFFGFLSAFATNIWFFVVCRFLTGFIYPGTTVQMSIILSELVGQKYRPVLVFVYWGFFSIGLIVLGLKSYLIRNWRTLFIICTLPYTIILGFYFFTPESIRWLLSRGDKKKAMRILRGIAKFNKRELSGDFDLSHEKGTDHCKPNPTDLFKPRSRALTSLIQGKPITLTLNQKYILSFNYSDSREAKKMVQFSMKIFGQFEKLLIREMQYNLFRFFVCKIGQKKPLKDIHREGR